MSRIGKLPVQTPQGVEAALKGSRLTVKGPKGSLDLDVHPDMRVVVDDGEIRVERTSDHQDQRALHGLTRALVMNMVSGVTEGFTRTLELVGVGYRAEPKGKSITLHVGYSHPIQYEPAEGVDLSCPTPTVVVVSGSDKQKVGQAAAEIRGFRPPEPYKGKGIRYQNEQVRRKAGKTAGS
ncbi:MAG: 50S ribosomal protein L6 [Gemmatimonadota bacterium]|nr:50S ribosomal protein L6 [Gemmatimonadota bacterium]